MTPSLITRRSLTLLLILLAPLAAQAQDTRGSLVPDAHVLLADGTSVPTENLKVGAVLRTWLPAGKVGTTKVTAIRRQHTDSFILIKAGEAEFRATGSHRVALAGGKFVRLDTLKVGDSVWVGGALGPVAAPITSLRLYPANLVGYDLTVEGHLPFFVDGLVAGD